MPPVLSVNELSMHFGELKALRDVSFAVEPKESVAVIGPNGAGKTTLLKILADIEKPTKGSVTSPHNGIGWVPQQPALYSKLSVEENLRLFARLEECRDVEGVVNAMLRQTGLSERSKEEVGLLSGGNQQRLNIAIGLLANPGVLLLDEPSASLDPRQRERLWEFVSGLSEHGTTVIFSTHNVEEAERNADRVLVLADGELLFAGSPQTLETEVGGDGLGFEGSFVKFLRDRGH